MSEEDHPDHYEESHAADGKEASKVGAGPKGFHVDEVRAEARKKIGAAAKSEGMSIERYENIQKAIRDGRSEDYTDDEFDSVGRIQEDFRAQTLSQIQSLFSKPWLQTSATRGLLKTAIRSDISDTTNNFSKTFVPQWDFGTLQSAIAAVNPPEVAINPETMNAFRNAMAHNQLPVDMEGLKVLQDEIQKVARAALTAGFATRTQSFLSNDDKLRYRWNHPVWHYTNGRALLSILGNGELWASSPENLNDSSELKHGFEIILGVFEERAREAESHDHKQADWQSVLSNVLNKDYIQNIINEVYIISASTERDSLTLWRNYADGDGFALGIDAGIELSADGIAVDEAENAESIRSDVPLISGWYRVSYKDAEKLNLARSFIQNAVEDIRRTSKKSWPALIAELRKQVVILASVMKDVAFRDEKEVRWITTNFTTFDPVYYEHGRRSIVPVLHIRTSAEENELLPLKGIRCSPVPDMSIVRTLEGLLKQRGYDRAANNVEQSQQPFKG
ncbi:DUF2971 domain-containing protein [Brevibacterium aurantiacum]|uniref:DUF2971 domain-containing protein n=1 Tax=Brevibacterium aurantiacum TaxID=273384 RepID=A0A556C808_BREAU|nr:DUF2971 domain-containing protein [Brevibacterium aurantiacum]TSI13574.1 DUF2971 domain-containing protein [Brevibacterium aurantiacum]